ncbi:hypothetical protein [Pseudalkalibacillus salsuginis]|uniref:hypothetical protein n=1 Tax=Pseudalkalibacillus salsuginis TaxID=2910972 RepID=UPI001F4496E2|nr:hypothetical protein [Pseudalkalibacillus salsuginis]MCF6409667.1 hypothetical protein [Pseudalkalibacillus salsuginis]
MKEFPQSLARLINGYSWEQITIGHSGAMTFLLNGPGYLERGPKASDEEIEKAQKHLSVQRFPKDKYKIAQSPHPSYHFRCFVLHT